MADGRLQVEGQYLYSKVPEKLLLDTRLKSQAVRLWALLMRIAWAGPTDFPSRKELAQALGCHPNTVDNHLNALIKAGWLRKHARAGDTNDFTLVPDPPSAKKLPTLADVVTLTTSCEGGSQPVVRVTSLKRASRRSTSVRTSSARDKDESDGDTDRRKSSWRREPEDEPVSEAYGGKPSSSPTHRSDSGAGLARRFESAAREALADLGPSQFNHRALVKELNVWMRDETWPTSPDRIRLMIEAFFSPRHPRPKSKVLWIGFKDQRQLLYEKTAKQHDMSTGGYADWEPESGQDWG